MTSLKEAARYLVEQAGIPANGQADGIALDPRDDLPEAEAPQVSAFPESAWCGLFGDYRDIVGPTTEAPDVYHYFGFAVAFGATLGRRLSVYHAVDLYPNFYIVLVGRTGLSRKDTARSRADSLLRELNEDHSDEPHFHRLYGIGSAEGLLECFAGEGKTVVVQEGELLSLMAKARRDATGNLLPQLTALYDCPSEHTLKTRSNPITAKRVFLSMLCGTTPKWLRKALTEDEAYGGFANRFIYAFGEAKDPMPYPPAVDATAWERLKAKVNKVRKWAGTGERRLDVDQAAIDHFSTWYKGYHVRASGDGILPALAVRFQSFAWKLGLLYAAQDQAKGLIDGHLTPALEVVDWLWKSNRAAFVDLTQHGRELEDNIQGRLRASATRALSKRDLYRSLKISAGELERAIEPLTRLGVVQAVEVASHKGFQLID